MWKLYSAAEAMLVPGGLCQRSVWLAACRRGPDKAGISTLRIKYNQQLKKWTIPFIMAPANTRVVRRSNALFHHSYGGLLQSFAGLMLMLLSCSGHEVLNSRCTSDAIPL